jgi:hypothetical protein
MALTTQNKLIIGITSVLGLTLIALAFKDKWMPKKDTINESKYDSGSTTSVIGDKNAKIQELFKEFATNPPKTKEEAEARALKYGITREDVAIYNANKPTIKVDGIKTSAPM